MRTHPLRNRGHALNRARLPSAASPVSKAEKKRLTGLNGRQRQALAELAVAHARGDAATASAHWLMASMDSPDHPEILHWAAKLHLAEGDADKAVAALRRALEQRPDDLQLLLALASPLAAQGRHEEALDVLRHASTCTEEPTEWLALAIAFDQQGHHADALMAAERTLKMAPNTRRAQLMRARCLQAIGQIADAAAEYRRIIATGKNAARAWFGLLDLKTEVLPPPELAALEQAERLAMDEGDRSLLGVALGQALEAAGRFDEAFAALIRANRAAAITRPWNPVAFSVQTRDIVAACEKLAIEDDATRGAEIIFLVGLPRSGSTLFEQVLAAHPQVEGASELPCLEQVIAQESRRRRAPVERWAADADAADWQRLGQEYLATTTRWRRQRPISTDKMPGNWRFAGAAMAMLPGARFIDCRRDALETGFSCFKQLFAQGMANWAFDFDHIAAYWKDYLYASDIWQTRQPRRFRTFRYEDLIADTESSVRALLAFCGLPFDPHCLEPHMARRAIRTASAAQVRQPIRAGTARAAHYGPLLDPLRQSMSA
ncbi:tetratricopeptide repeat protein [Xanthomonadaceae bacterium JHOS43]|nr:tetratricopeptide repeat protein [Xanthomonadaceae bacterium JHOS43]